MTNKNFFNIGFNRNKDEKEEKNEKKKKTLKRKNFTTFSLSYGMLVDNNLFLLVLFILIL